MKSATLELASNISLSRRSLLRWSAAAATGVLPALDGRLASLLAQEPKTASNLVPLNRFSRMVQEWFVEQVKQAESKIKDRLAGLNTKQDAENYVRSVQQRIRECFGPEPERTPLNARVTGVVERDTYKIEKIIFASRPNFPTGNASVRPRRKSTNSSVCSFMASFGRIRST